MATHHHTRVLGVDIGGVLMGGHRARRLQRQEGEDTSFFGPNYLLTPALPGALEAMARLCAATSAGAAGAFDAIHFVSKCGDEVQHKTRTWFAHHGLLAQWGLPESHLHFCERRHEKAPICERLGVTHFIDDRLSVLQHLTTVRYRYCFDPPAGELEAHADLLDAPGITRVGDWSELEPLLRR